MRLAKTKQSLESHPHRGARADGSRARSGSNPGCSSSKVAADAKDYSDLIYIEALSKDIKRPYDMEEMRLPDKAINEIKQFVDQVEQYLLNPANVCYFEIDPKQLHEHQMNGINGEKLNRVAKKSGVYAIWIKTATTTAPQYIGHTAGATARNRLINHFFKKHEKTGAQLANVTKMVADGHSVGFTFVALHPPLIRLYVESELIARHHELCIWNIQSKGPKGKSTIMTVYKDEQNV